MQIVIPEAVVPLCRGHHRELHRFGDEAVWWERTGIDAIEVARTLWLESHPLSTHLRNTGSLLPQSIRPRRPAQATSDDAQLHKE